MSLSVLLVDDNRFIITALRQVLESTFKGAEVRSARTNAEARMLLEHFRPALICTDFNRPGGNGLDLLSELRVDPRTRHTPVVLVSGQADGRELEYYRAGFNAVVPKPFTVPEYLDAIHRVLHLDAESLR